MEFNVKKMTKKKTKSYNLYIEKKKLLHRAWKKHSDPKTFVQVMVLIQTKCYFPTTGVTIEPVGLPQLELLPFEFPPPAHQLSD